MEKKFATIAQIIGKVNPKQYAGNGKELLEEYSSQDKIPADRIKEKGAEGDHTIVYDSSSEGLEPIYFWLVDLIKSFGLNPEKLVDNFSSSPGSGHFGEIGTKMSTMQQQAQNIMGQINTVLRSTINIIYDLKEFKIRLQSYDLLNEGSKEEKEAALLSLKQLWLDKVDITKGNSAIKPMALGQAGFQTLLDAFLVARDEKEAEKLDLNDRVKRIVKSRIVEFNIWIKNSEDELRKRYKLERSYLKSQVNSLKLYSRWARPYLKAATELEQKDQGRSPDFVKTFNTIIYELTLLGKSEIRVKDLALDGTFPSHLSKYSDSKRKYYSCILVDFRFRGIPQRVTQGQHGHYAFGGKAEVRFRSYALNEDELKMLEQELDGSDLENALGLVEGSTTESLGQLEADINEFLDEKEEEESKPKKSKELNPFMALIGRGNPASKKEKKKGEKKKEKILEVKGDNWEESEYLRPQAKSSASGTLFTIYDIYKKSHGMASYT